MYGVLRWIAGAMAVVVLGLSGVTDAPAEPSEVEGRTSAVLPVEVEKLFATRCRDCHGAQQPEAALSLRNVWDVLLGGDSGPAVVPGHPEQSLLWKQVNQGAMPPPESGSLSQREKQLLRRWIATGKFPTREQVEQEKQRRLRAEALRHWAFRPVADPPVPQVRRKGWAWTPIDRFIQARWEQAGLVPGPEADAYTLVRRVFYDLTGLPPTEEELERFVPLAGTAEGWSRVVDYLLGSPHFGEHWGRHWLDVVRYADTVGGGANYTMNNAWRYRDYCIAAFNQDKPYDRFLTEQIAGDLLPWKTPQQREEQLIATGFLALGPKDFTDVDKVKLVADVIDEQLDTLGKAFLGLAIGCARCHGHKFDPIPMQDYYALAGIFYSTRSLKPQDDTKRFHSWPDWLRIPLPTLTEEKRKQLLQQAEAEEKALKARQKRLREQIAQWEKRSPRPVEQLEHARQQLQQVEDELQRRRSLRQYYGDPVPVLIGVQEADKPRHARIAVRGNPRQLGREVPRGVIRALGVPCPPIPPDQSGRLQLARWMTDPRHPLTSRVMVNRIWQHLLGRGLVESVDNFGTRGTPPSHPKLLDYLARRFVEDGWSVKRMIRRIVTSRVYRLACADDAHNRQRDPENRLLWRRNARRLRAEELRDSLLWIGRRLNPQRGGPSLEHIGRFGLGKLYPIRRPGLWNRRAVYLPVYRGMVFDQTAMFFTFDFADPNLTVGRRTESIVPTQALFLMNNPLVLDCAQALAKRLMQDSTAEQRVRRGFLAVLGRPPQKAELEQALQFVRTLPDEATPGRHPGTMNERAWAAWCQVLFSSSEFLLVD